MLSCRDVTRLATALDEGALRWADRWRLRLHVLMCRHCRRYLAQMRLVQRLAAEVPRDNAPGELHARVREAFKEGTSSGRVPGG